MSDRTGARSDATGWHGAFLLFLVVWIAWAVGVSAGAVPGLLDDGSHMIHSERYRTYGYLTTVLRDLRGVADHARFYEVQYGLLGLYNVLFGHDVSRWYLATFALCLATGLLLYAIVRATTGQVPSAVAAAMVFLTASPLAEAVRGNFGKVEVVMAFFFALALALWLLARGCAVRLRGRRARAVVVASLAASLAAMVLAAVSKESGRLLALALVLAAGLGARSAWHEHGERRWRLSLAALGLVGASACYLAFLPSQDNAYIRSYFALDLSLSHLGRSAAFYLGQSGDVAAVALVTLVLLSIQARDGSLLEGDEAAAHLFIALFATTGVFLGLLLTTRFQVPYYLYVPGMMLALVFGWAVRSTARARRRWLVAFLLLTRLYSVPYNYYVAGAQRYFDEVNDRAMRKVLEIAPPRVISLDIGDNSQFIQEWNFLRWFAFAGRLAPLYGGPPFFEAWSYQQDIRNLDPRSFDPALIHGNVDVTKMAPDASLVPQPGDVLAVRGGTLSAFHIWLRGVMPQSLDADEHLRILDRDALEPAGEVGGQLSGVAPLCLGAVRFDYRWLFFRVTAPPRYLLMGRQADGWMLPNARVRLLPQPGSVLRLTLEVPGWLPFRWPWRLMARAGETVVARLEVVSPGVHRMDIPCDAGGTLLLESDQWFQPSALGVSVDTRMLSYRVAEVEYEGPAGSAGPQR